jgi:hypothetical protein
VADAPLDVMTRVGARLALRADGHSRHPEYAADDLDEADDPHEADALGEAPSAAKDRHPWDADARGRAAGSRLLLQGRFREAAVNGWEHRLFHPGPTNHAFPHCGGRSDDRCCARCALPNGCCSCRLGHASGRNVLAYYG